MRIGGDEAKAFELLSDVAEWLISNKNVSWKVTSKLGNLQRQEQAYRY